MANAPEKSLEFNSQSTNLEDSFIKFVNAETPKEMGEQLGLIFGNHPDNYYGTYTTHALETLEELVIKNAALAVEVTAALKDRGFFKEEVTDTKSIPLLSAWQDSDPSGRGFPGEKAWKITYIEEPNNINSLSKIEWQATMFLIDPDRSAAQEYLHTLGFDSQQFKILLNDNPELVIKVINRTLTEHTGVVTHTMLMELAAYQPDKASTYIDICKEEYPNDSYAGELAVACDRVDLALSEAARFSQIGNIKAEAELASLLAESHPREAVMIGRQLIRMNYYDEGVQIILALAETDPAAAKSLAAGFKELTTSVTSPSPHFLALNGEIAAVTANIPVALDNLKEIIGDPETAAFDIYRLAVLVASELDETTANKISQALHKSPDLEHVFREIYDSRKTEREHLDILVSAEAKFLNASTNKEVNQDHFYDLFRENSITNQQEITPMGLNICVQLSEDRQKELFEFLVDYQSPKTTEALLSLGNEIKDSQDPAVQKLIDPLFAASLRTVKGATDIERLASDLSTQRQLLNFVLERYSESGYFKLAREIVEGYFLESEPAVSPGSDIQQRILANLHIHMINHLNDVRYGSQPLADSFMEVGDQSEQVELLIDIDTEAQNKVIVGMLNHGDLREVLVIGEALNRSTETGAKASLNQLLEVLAHDDVSSKKAQSLAVEMALRDGLFFVANTYINAGRFKQAQEIAAEYRRRKKQRMPTSVPTS